MERNEQACSAARELTEAEIAAVSGGFDQGETFDPNEDTFSLTTNYSQHLEWSSMTIESLDPCIIGINPLVRGLTNRISVENICGTTAGVDSMPRPFTRPQALQNQAFLERLALSGNARLAAREVGKKYSTMQHRRSVNAAFAQDWEGVLAAVQARLHLAGGKRGPEPGVPAGTGACGKEQRKGRTALRQAQDERSLDFARDERGRLRTIGGEPMVVRTRSGKLQIRLAHPDKLTKKCEQLFLLALSATANVRLSAAAAGASARAFYRRRESNPAFAREMRLALKTGWERLELAARAAALPESHADDQWRNWEPAPIPPMSPFQALQLLHLHEKSVHQSWEQPHRRRRRGESDEVYCARLAAMWQAEKGREAEEEALRRAARYETAADWRFEEEAPGPELPPLHLVTGWSRADPDKKVHNPDLALFGGWRIAEMERSRRTDSAAGARTKLPSSGRGS
jgi:hypothetical protein